MQIQGYRHRDYLGELALMLRYLTVNDLHSILELARTVSLRILIIL